MKVAFVISFLLILLPLAYLAKDFGYEYMEVDSCLDSGGSYDYKNSKCDKNENHVFVSYGERREELVLSCIAVSVSGVVVLTLTRRKYKIL
ncbi:MAG: hypothetical protein ABFD08_05750 [Syntrophomonas sp.]